MDISALTIPQLKAELTKLEVPFKSKMHKDELAVLLENALIKAAQVTTPNSEPAQSEWPAQRAAVSDIGVTPTLSEVGSVITFPQAGIAAIQSAAHMPNSERMQRYAYANIGGDRGILSHTPKLTPKQMRRVRKNANKHGEDLLIGPPIGWDTRNGVPVTAGGHILIARTPKGLGIFYRFND